MSYKYENPLKNGFKKVNKNKYRKIIKENEGCIFLSETVYKGQ